jgi:hypothetical protein
MSVRPNFTTVYLISFSYAKFSHSADAEEILLLLPIQCSPLIEYFRTIVHNGCDNKGAQIYLQVQVKNSLMMRLRDAAAQYPLLESI